MDPMQKRSRARHRCWCFRHRRMKDNRQDRYRWDRPGRRSSRPAPEWFRRTSGCCKRKSSQGRSAPRPAARRWSSGTRSAPRRKNRSNSARHRGRCKSRRLRSRNRPGSSTAPIRSAAGLPRSRECCCLDRRTGFERSRWRWPNGRFRHWPCR